MAMRWILSLLACWPSVRALQCLAPTTTTTTTRTAPLFAQQQQGALALSLDAKQAQEMTPRACSLFDEALEAVKRINALEESVEKMSDAELRARVKELRAGKLSEKEAMKERYLDETFAVAREAGWRVLGQRAFDVQLIGGYVMAQGGLAEMATGEGKTLAAVAPALHAALTSIEKNAVVVTANDYLAARDADGVGQIFRFLGLTVGLVEGDADAEEKRDAYKADVVYASNQQLGFDYLRDQLAYDPNELVMKDELKGKVVKPFGLCIVDEADSILIDEARTPLVISEKRKDGGGGLNPDALVAAKDTAMSVLAKNVHYTFDEKENLIDLTEEGLSECKEIFRVDDLFAWKGETPWGLLLMNALKAKEQLERDRDYVVKEAASGEQKNDEGAAIALLDAFTGRELVGRRYADGLQQAVEVKEGLKPSPTTKTAASITFQSFFGRDGPLASKVAAMTGTALSEAREFREVYGLETVAVPTNLPVGRRDYPDAVYRSVEAKFNAAADEVCRSMPRPVLVGTTSLDDSETFAELLRAKLKDPSRVQVLNAKPENAYSESRIVASAGRLGAVTVATNMAGRGTDVVLGGDPKELTRDVLERLLITGDDFDFGEEEEDVVVVGKNEEEEDPPEASSTTSFPRPPPGPRPAESLASAETREKLKDAAAEVRVDVFGGEVKALSAANARQIAAAVCEKQPLQRASLKALRSATRLLETELQEELEKEREAVLKRDGLYVVGTERHESRRIDRQLRGRSGRQGDPGSSRFFVAIDDKIFKLFGGDKLKNLMKTFRLGDELPVEAKSIAGALDDVQAKVEAKNYDVRKTVLDYDRVLDGHRRIVYKTRRQLLTGKGDEIFTTALEWLEQSAEAVLKSVLRDEPDPAQRQTLLNYRLTAYFGADLLASHPWRGALLQSLSSGGGNGGGEKTKDLLRKHAEDFLKHHVMPKVKANRPAIAETTSFAQLAILRIDFLWSEHLANVRDLQDAVQFRSFGGSTPIDEFTQDSKLLFDRLDIKIKSDTIYSLLQLAQTQPQQGAAGGK